ncbi:MAG TPA: DUF4403 family protein [Paludibacteraceae bacterium]|nr:DUF4403 family protein [Paludibacteraceae bacterium]
MKTLYFQISTFILVIVLMASCKTTLQIEPPRESYLPSNLTPATSELPLLVEVDVKKLESAINQKINGLVFEGDKLNNQDLSIKIWKAQNFSFNVKNNVIEYRVPLKLWTRFAWSVDKFGLSMGDTYEATGSIALNYKTTIEIDKNWKLLAKTTSHGFQWIDTPKLNVIGVSVPITPIATIALQQSEELITSQIDAILAQTINIKKYVAMAWKEAQKPMQVSPENDLWVRISPKNVYVSPFTTNGQKLYVAISIQAVIESFMGVQPVQNKLTVLPPFTVSANQPKDFNLNIATDITYEKISELAKSQLQNKTFSEGNKSITITDLSVFGSEGKAIFVADVIGSIKGRIYFTGTLGYNAETMSIEVLQPEFDIKTKNALVKSANWLLNGFIIKKITPYLTYPVQDELTTMKTEANKMLTNYKVYDGVDLTGKLHTISVQRIDLVPGAIRLHANVGGNIALKVNDIHF